MSETHLTTVQHLTVLATMPMTKEDQAVFCRTKQSWLRWNVSEAADRRDARVMRAAAFKRADHLIGFAAIRVGVLEAGGRMARDCFDFRLAP